MVKTKSCDWLWCPAWRISLTNLPERGHVQGQAPCLSQPARACSKTRGAGHQHAVAVDWESPAQHGHVLAAFSKTLQAKVIGLLHLQPSPSIFQIFINEILHQSLRDKNGNHETGLSGQGVWGGECTQLSQSPSPTLRPKETPPDSQAQFENRRLNQPGWMVVQSRRKKGEMPITDTVGERYNLFCCVTPGTLGQDSTSLPLLAEWKSQV